jgi:hypothetical protein
MEPLYYPASCYDNQDLSPTTHRHAAADGHFQPGLSGACGGMTYGTTTSLIYTESDNPTTATALPAPAPHPTIAHDQNVSGHDLIQWDPMVMRSALYEVSTLPHPVGDDTGSQRLVLREGPPPPPPPPPLSSPQIQAILQSGHSSAHIPRQLPRSTTIRPSLQQRSGSRHTWLLPMRRASTLRQYQYQCQHRRQCVRRCPSPSRQIFPLAANLRWATYHTQRTSPSRLSAGTRPCTEQGRSYLLPRPRGRGRQRQRLLAPSCRP